MVYVPAEKLGASWQNAETMAIRALAQLPFGRVHQLRYENLVQDPKGELTNLARFIGLETADEKWLDAAAALVKIKPPAWPQLDEAKRKRVDDACRFAMGLLYGAEVLSPPEPELALSTR